MRSLEFLLGLLDGPDPACVSADDCNGPHGAALTAWQERGFIDREPFANPVPSCPHCDDGVPYKLQDRYLCHRCRSVIDPRQMLLWGFNREAFLGWLSKALKCHGGLRQLDPVLWQLGTRTTQNGPLECFYCRPGNIPEAARRRLFVYRNTLVLFGRSLPADCDANHGRYVSLLEILSDDGHLAITDPERLQCPRGGVRFDKQTGVLWVGDALFGEVPVGGKEFCFLACLAENLDQFVPYTVIKRAVVTKSGSLDETEEATFSQKIKNRIKSRYIPRIDAVLVTTNKGDGYRLRGQIEV